MPRRKTPKSGASSLLRDGAASFAAEGGFRQSNGGPASAPDETLDGRQLLDAAGVILGDSDKSVCHAVTPDTETLETFIDAVAMHRHYGREASAVWRSV